jgi:predicted nucleic acid-binding protein
LLENIKQKLTIVTLDAEEYYGTLQQAAQQAIVGGAVYDLLLARCALKASAEIIYTWNLRDFRRFGPQIAKRIRTP